MSNVLNEEQKQQVIALGRLGWSLRRIERETSIRRETVSAYLKEAGVALRPPRGPLENALRRFKKKVLQEEIIREVKRHSFYLKPGQKRRAKQALAWGK